MCFKQASEMDEDSQSTCDLAQDTGSEFFAFSTIVFCR